MSLGQLWITSWITIFLISFLDALLLLIFFNFAGIAFLSALGYWQLYWLNVAVMMPVGSAVGLSAALRDLR